MLGPMAAVSPPHPRVPSPGEARPGRAWAPRRDAEAKLTGQARYVDDLVVPGAWHGATVRSSEPHARLLGIELDPAFDWSSVVVVTAADIPGENVVALMSDDQPALVADEIRHVAEPIALVAAPDPALARAARDAIRPRTEPLPPSFEPLASDVVFKAFEIAKGDLEEGFRAADVVIEGTYRTGLAEQLYIEPQGMIAIPEPDGGLTVHGSLQCPYYVHTALARALGLDRDRIRVVQAETGGGFGGKEEYPSILAIHAALLARKAGRPVRMVYDRHEDLAATTKRHPSVVTHRTGVTRDGRLVAQDIEVVLDAGAYCTLSPVVVSRAGLHATGPYACPNVRVRARAVSTNMPPAGAYRGFGAPQSEFAAELQMARVAEALRMSPAELRRRNAYRLGDVTATGQVLRSSVAAVEVLERAVELAGYEAEAGRGRGRSRGESPARGAEAIAADGAVASGTGLALGWHGAGFTGSGEARLASVASVELTADGAIRLLASSTEIGQGSRTVLARVVAETLGVPEDAVEPVPLDTSLVPDTGPTVASRSTMVGGGLLARAAEHLRCDVEAKTGRPFAESYRDAAARWGAMRTTERFDGFPGIEWDDATYRGDAYPAYSWTAVVARVDVDLDTGVVDVRSVVAVDDAGRIVDRVLAEGQVEGGTVQGVGYATTEEVLVEAGRYRNDRLATYVIPTALDAPRIDVAFVESPYPGVPHGAKGLGELPLDVVAPAIVDAIHDATGAWIHELPASPERVLAALEATAAPAAEGGR
jgi:CO/xanthine dehydrogenase Mo-binding subunit